jgi:hypothetical protein
LKESGRRTGEGREVHGPVIFLECVTRFNAKQAAIAMPGIGDGM